MSDSDDDVVFIPNPSAKAQLPHARCACETHIFVAPPGGQLRHHGTAKNKETCATCFCYVCDKPAKECTSWAVHCDATDKGPNAAYWKIRRNEVKRGGAPAPPKQQTLAPPRPPSSSSYQPDFIPAKRYTGMRPGYQFKNSYRGMGYYKSASAPAARPAATPSLSAERKAMRDGLAAFAADNSARELYAVTRDASYPSSAIGAARYLTNGASDSVLDELLAEARKDATLKVARVTRSGGTLTSHGVIVWKPASTASGRRVYKLGKPLCENQPVSELVPPRHRAAAVTGTASGA